MKKQNTIKLFQDSRVRVKWDSDAEEYYFSENSPFGGYKMSGMGRNDGALGFHEVVQKKVVGEFV